MMTVSHYLNHPCCCYLDHHCSKKVYFLNSVTSSLMMAKTAAVESLVKMMMTVSHYLNHPCCWYWYLYYLDQCSKTVCSLFVKTMTVSHCLIYLCLLLRHYSKMVCFRSSEMMEKRTTVVHVSFANNNPVQYMSYCYIERCVACYVEDRCNYILFHLQFRGTLGKV